MDTKLDIKKAFLSSFCFCLLPTDVAWDIFSPLFMLGNCIGICFGKMAPVTAIMDAILFMIQCNG